MDNLTLQSSRHECNANEISRKMAVISAGQKSCSVLDKYQFVLKLSG